MQDAQNIKDWQEIVAGAEQDLRDALTARESAANCYAHACSTVNAARESLMHAKLSLIDAGGEEAELEVAALEGAA